MQGYVVYVGIVCGLHKESVQELGFSRGHKWEKDRVYAGLRNISNQIEKTWTINGNWDWVDEAGCVFWLG